jgi:hypothetical protein
MRIPSTANRDALGRRATVAIPANSKRTCTPLLSVLSSSSACSTTVPAIRDYEYFVNPERSAGFIAFSFVFGRTRAIIRRVAFQRTRGPSALLDIAARLHQEVENQMTLAERRIVAEFESTKLPALKTRVEEATAFAVPLEVKFETLATPDESRLYMEGGLQERRQKIVIQNVKGCVYGDCWATLVDGVLTLDHDSLANAYDIEARKNGLIAVLESSL